MIHRAEQRLHPLGPLPADDVVHAAGRERHHELDRPARERALRERARRGKRGRGCGKAELESVAAVHAEFSRHCTLNPSFLMIGVQRAYSLATSCCAGFGAGIEHRLEARRDHELLNLRIGHRGAGLVGERVDDVLRHAGRGEQAVEIRGHHARQSRFDGGRDVGRGLRAACSRRPRGCGPCLVHGTAAAARRHSASSSGCGREARSVTPGAEPLYGMWVMSFTPISSLNSSPERLVMVPAPAEP